MSSPTSKSVPRKLPPAISSNGREVSGSPYNILSSRDATIQSSAQLALQELKKEVLQNMTKASQTLKESNLTISAITESLERAKGAHSGHQLQTINGILTKILEIKQTTEENIAKVKEHFVSDQQLYTDLCKINKKAELQIKALQALEKQCDKGNLLSQGTGHNRSSSTNEMTEEELVLAKKFVASFVARWGKSQKALLENQKMAPKDAASQLILKTREQLLKRLTRIASINNPTMLEKIVAEAVSENRTRKARTHVASSSEKLPMIDAIVEKMTKETANASKRNLATQFIETLDSALLDNSEMQTLFAKENFLTNGDGLLGLLLIKYQRIAQDLVIKHRDEINDQARLLTLPQRYTPTHTDLLLSLIENKQIEPESFSLKNTKTKTYEDEQAQGKKSTEWTLGQFSLFNSLITKCIEVYFDYKTSHNLLNETISATELALLEHYYCFGNGYEFMFFNTQDMLRFTYFITSEIQEIQPSIENLILNFLNGKVSIKELEEKNKPSFIAVYLSRIVQNIFSMPTQTDAQQEQKGIKFVNFIEKLLDIYSNLSREGARDTGPRRQAFLNYLSPLITTPKDPDEISLAFIAQWNQRLTSFNTLLRTALQQYPSIDPYTKNYFLRLIKFIKLLSHQTEDSQKIKQWEPLP